MEEEYTKHRKVLENLKRNRPEVVGICNTADKLRLMGYYADLDAAIRYFDDLLSEAKGCYSFEYDRRVDYEEWSEWLKKKFDLRSEPESIKYPNEVENIGINLLESIRKEEEAIEEREGTSIWKESFSKVAGGVICNIDQIAKAIDAKSKNLSVVLLMIKHQLEDLKNGQGLETLYNEIEKRYVKRKFPLMDATYRDYTRWKESLCSDMSEDKINSYIASRLGEMLRYLPSGQERDGAPTLKEIEMANKIIENNGWEKIEGERLALILQFMDYKGGVFELKSKANAAKYLYIHRGEIEEDGREHFVRFIRLCELVKEEKQKLGKAASKDELPTHKKVGRKKEKLFADESQKRIEIERVKAYMTEHQLSEKMWTSGKKDEISKVVCCFAKEWKSRQYLTGTDISATALVSFFIDECGVKTDVKQETINNKMRDFMEQSVDEATSQAVDAKFIS